MSSRRRRGGWLPGWDRETFQGEMTKASCWRSPGGGGESVSGLSWWVSTQTQKKRKLGGSQLTTLKDVGSRWSGPGVTRRWVRTAEELPCREGLWPQGGRLRMGRLSGRPLQAASGDPGPRFYIQHSQDKTAQHEPGTWIRNKLPGSKSRSGRVNPGAQSVLEVTEDTRQMSC